VEMKRDEPSGQLLVRLTEKGKRSQMNIARRDGVFSHKRVTKE